MIEIVWNAFKPSGKWGYGGTVLISGDNRVWEREKLLAEIAANQKEAQPTVITSGRYVIVIHETEKQSEDPKYHGFYTQLFPATEPWE